MAASYLTGHCFRIAPTCGTVFRFPRLPQNARVSGSNRPLGCTGLCHSAAPRSVDSTGWRVGGPGRGRGGPRWGSSLHSPSDEMLGQVRGQALDLNGGLRSGEEEGCPALLGPSPRCLRLAGHLCAILVPASGLRSRYAALGSAPESPWSSAVAFVPTLPLWCPGHQPPLLSLHPVSAYL